jgi:hypothetical protein
MIPLSELRPGNIITGIYDEENELSEEVKVVCIDPTGEITDYEIWVDGTNDHYDEFQPIELTEEWFTEKGFESTTKEWKGNGADYQPENNKTKQTIFDIGDEIKLIFEIFSYRVNETDKWLYDRSVMIKYCDDTIFLYRYELHVLQNLIHALTGKELTIKK